MRQFSGWCLPTPLSKACREASLSQHWMQKESNQGSKIRGARIATQASRRYMNAWSEENCLARIDGSRPWKYAARCTSPWWKQTAAHHEFLVTTSSAFWTSPTRLLPRLHATVLLDGTPPMGTCTRDPYVPEDVRPDVIMVHQTSTPFSLTRGLPERGDLRYTEPCVRNGGTHDGLVPHTSGTCTAGLPTQKLRYTHHIDKPTRASLVALKDIIPHCKPMTIPRLPITTTYSVIYTDAYFKLGSTFFRPGDHDIPNWDSKKTAEIENGQRLRVGGTRSKSLSGDATRFPMPLIVSSHGRSPRSPCSVGEALVVVLEVRPARWTWTHLVR